MTALKAFAPAQQAGILCNDPNFQRFAATRSGLPQTSFNASAAAEYLRECCQIESRRQLNDDAGARDHFDRLRTEFDAWRGRIARQETSDDRRPRERH